MAQMELRQGLGKVGRVVGAEESLGNHAGVL